MNVWPGFEGPAEDELDKPRRVTSMLKLDRRNKGGSGEDAFLFRVKGCNLTDCRGPRLCGSTEQKTFCAVGLASPCSEFCTDFTGSEAYRLRPTRSRPDKKPRNDPKEVLNKLRIGKSALGSSALLKASFPTLQNSEPRCVRSGYFTPCTHWS